MQFYPLAVDAIIDETRDAKSFICTPQVPDAGLFSYQSGQYVTFRIPVPGSHLQRCYSLSQPPSAEPTIQVTVKRVANGRGSNWFHDTVRVGEVIEATKPNGRFVLQSMVHPIIFCAAGSGITPIISLIQTTLDTTDQKVYLLYANHNQETIIFYQKIQLLRETYPNRFICWHHLSRNLGRLTKDRVLDYLQIASGAHLYICGPEPFMRLIEKVAIQQHFDQHDIFIEHFATPADQDATNTPATATRVASRFMITLDGNTCEVPYTQGCTLLECILSAGFEPAYLCKEGHCGSCMAVIQSGEVAMRKTTSLSARDVARNYILLCQSVPLSQDVWVDCDA